MKKFSCVLGALLLLTVNAGIASAYSINYTSANGNGGLTSPYAWAQVETFDDPLIFAWAGNYQMITGAVLNQAAPPAGDATEYVSVPDNGPSGTATATLPGTYNYLGLWWGSVDDYNTLTFLMNGSSVLSFTGLNITNPANGDQQAPATNLYVNFLDLPDFNGFSMSSTQYAFEADNIAVGVAPIPEPGTIILLGAGLLGLGLYGRKRMKS